MGHDRLGGGRDALLAALTALAAQPDAPPQLCVVLDLGGSSKAGGMARTVRQAHAAEVTEAAAARLGESIGPGHARFLLAADCHAILLPGADPELGAALARRALDGFAEPLDCAGLRLPVAAAAGVLAFIPGAMAPEAVLAMAMAAAQDAHEDGDRLLVCGGEAGAAYTRGLALIDALPQALAAPDQLSLAYQPRLALSTELCTKVEALIRWRHPVLGQVSPGEFIPLVEELGLSRPLTEWVINRALAQLAEWQRAGIRLGVAINIAVPNLEEEDLPDRLAAALARHNIPAETVELELTESVPRLTSDRSRRTVLALQALGIRFAIDDFGTGYSNLADLRTPEAQILKIDRGFVRDLASNPRDRAIVEAMVGLAHRLGYWVVVEGIETAEVFEALIRMNCDEGQGYFIARPMPPAEVAAWIEARRAARRAAMAR